MTREDEIAAFWSNWQTPTSWEASERAIRHAADDIAYLLARVRDVEQVIGVFTRHADQVLADYLASPEAQEQMASALHSIGEFYGTSYETDHESGTHQGLAATILAALAAAREGR